MAAQYGIGWLAKTGLLHDASEAYTGDISRPLKTMPQMAGFRAIEHAVQTAIIHRLCNRSWDSVKPIIALYDNIAAKAEAYVLMNSGGKDWGWDGVESAEINIRCLSPKDAKQEFLLLYDTYYREE
jgi:hypothetical protein